MDHPNPSLGARLCQVSGPLDVAGVGVGVVGLAAVDVGGRCAVDEGGRPVAGQRGGHGHGVSDIEVGEGEGGGLLAEQRGGSASQHAAGTQDEERGKVVHAVIVTHGGAGRIAGALARRPQQVRRLDGWCRRAVNSGDGFA